jgi:hypothetical protein
MRFVSWRLPVDDRSDKWPTVMPVFRSIHASWLNQIEIYFFRGPTQGVLTPGDFADLAALQAALLGFRHQYETAVRSSGHLRVRT